MSRKTLFISATLVSGLAACALPASLAHARAVPVAATQAEQRVTTVAFDENEIVHVPVSPGGVQLVFSPDETQFDVGLSGAWQWDRSQNTLFFLGGAGVEAKVVYVVSSLPGGGTRRYQIELTPVGAGGLPAWKRPPGAMKARAPGAASDVADVLPDTLALPSYAALPSAAPPAVVRFTYVREEATARAEAARKRRDAARERIAMGGETPRARVSRAEQSRLRAEVESAARDQAARKRCNVMWRGDQRLVPRALCNTGLFTTFAYTGMTVPALFAVGPDGKNVKVQQEPVPGQPGLILARATSEFWRAHYGDVQVAEMYDASYDPTGGFVTGTDTASPQVRMTVPDTAVGLSPTSGMASRATRAVP